MKNTLVCVAMHEIHLHASLQDLHILDNAIGTDTCSHLSQLTLKLANLAATVSVYITIQ